MKIFEESEENTYSNSPRSHKCSLQKLSLHIPWNFNSLPMKIHRAPKMNIWYSAVFLSFLRAQGAVENFGDVSRSVFIPLFPNFLVSFGNVTTSELNSYQIIHSLRMQGSVAVILLMAEILHHLGCMKPYK